MNEDDTFNALRRESFEIVYKNYTEAPWSDWESFLANSNWTIELFDSEIHKRGMPCWRRAQCLVCQKENHE